MEDEAEIARKALEEAREELRETQAGLECATTRAERAEEYGHRTGEQLERVRQEAQLEKLQAVAEETRKWEAREARMVRRLEELERERSPADKVPPAGGDHTQRYVTAGGLGPDSGKPTRGVESPPSDVQGGDQTGICLPGVGSSQHSLPPTVHFPHPAHTSHSTPLSVEAPVFSPTSQMAPATVPSTTPQAPLPSEPLGQQSPGIGAAVEPVPTLAATPRDALSVALLAQQLPQLPNFTGGHLDGDGESIEDWLERLELVAGACNWDDQAKLVNVATRLRGEASRFYRSCTPQQRSSYSVLATALRKRFTPVRIQSVQSSRFHERRQLYT